jgi:DNA topoisomerase VI subunit B
VVGLKARTPTPAATGRELPKVDHAGRQIDPSAKRKASNPQERRDGPRLNRQTFKTSRLLEFCSEKELVLQTGHPLEDWPLVILKELADNGIDACEEAETAPNITVNVADGAITVQDNGPGIPPATVKGLLDFGARVSSREAYCSPTRGAQGNALKTLIAMPFALDGNEGETIIEARGIRHRIRFTVDSIRQTPKVEHLRESSNVKIGTSIRVGLPQSARLELDSARERFLQIAGDYAWLNPHLSLRIEWDDEVCEFDATDASWSKWRPSDPTSAHWYDRQRFQRLSAAYVADDQDRNRSRTVRDFISEFRGLSGSAKQKRVLDVTGMARTALADLFADGEPDKARIGELLAAMQGTTNPVNPQDLGSIGREHLSNCFEQAGADLETFQYKRMLRSDDGVPSVLELAFAYCPDGVSERRIITGVNWSVGIANPFRRLGDFGTSLDGYLQEQRVGAHEPVMLVAHLASPQITFTDRGKSALALGGEMAGIARDVVSGLRAVTKAWCRQRRAEERNAAARASRLQRLARNRVETAKAVAFEIMEKAYLAASNNGTLPATARQVMYAARPEIQARTGQQLDDQYFCQRLLPDYIEERGVDYDIAWDDRGHFTEPHTRHTIGLGTISVRDYVAKIAEPDLNEASFASAEVATRGPNQCFGAVLFIEKEGFLPLFEKVGLAERFDVAVMSSKGFSTTAARHLVDRMCGEHDIPLFVLHDFDKAGFSILGTLQRTTRRYRFKNQIKVVDLGLRLQDVDGLQSEEAFDRGGAAQKAENLRRNGATAAEADFLLRHRVELNAMTADQLVAFVERKLKQHGVKKIIPNKKELAEAYRLFRRGKAIDEIGQRELSTFDPAAVAAPSDLEKRVRKHLAKHPADRWDAAVEAIAGEDQ